MNIESILYLILLYKYTSLIILFVIVGYPLTIIAGALSYFGYLEIIPAFFILFISEIVADCFWFLLGRFFHNKVTLKHEFLQNIKKKSIDKLKKRFERHPLRMLVLIKVIFPLTLAGLIVFGSTKYEFKKFLVYLSIIAFISEIVLFSLGYFSGISLEKIMAYWGFGYNFLIIPLTILIILYIIFIFLEKDKLSEIK